MNTDNDCRQLRIKPRKPQKNTNENGYNCDSLATNICILWSANYQRCQFLWYTGLRHAIFLLETTRGVNVFVRWGALGKIWFINKATMHAMKFKCWQVNCVHCSCRFLFRDKFFFLFVVETLTYCTNTTTCTTLWQHVFKPLSRIIHVFLFAILFPYFSHTCTYTHMERVQFEENAVAVMVVSVVSERYCGTVLFQPIAPQSPHTQDTKNSPHTHYTYTGRHLLSLQGSYSTYWCNQPNIAAIV